MPPGGTKLLLLERDGLLDQLPNRAALELGGLEDALQNRLAGRFRERWVRRLHDLERRTLDVTGGVYNELHLDPAGDAGTRQDGRIARLGLGNHLDGIIQL